MNPTPEPLAAWIGRSETLHDVIGATPVRALAATLDREPAPVETGTPLPPLWHWLYFLPLHRASEIGPDGHAKRGGFLPPVPLPRRMWAGSRFDFRAPLRVGDRVARTSTIENVASKQGRSGPLVFVTVRHELRADGGTEPALVEWHDIVYRDAKTPGEAEPAPQPAPADAPWQRELVPDDVLLFRYSALTFNGHRIHYDRRYVTEVEGYPGLVVHGPLHRDAADGPAAPPCARGRGRAASASRPCGRPSTGGRCASTASATATTVRLWAQDFEGWLTMDAVATLK